MIKVLLLEKEVHERFIIQEKIPRAISVIVVKTINEAKGYFSSKDIKAALIGPSTNHNDYKRIIDLYKRVRSTETLLFYYRERNGMKNILSDKSFKGHFIHLSLGTNDTESIIKNILIKEYANQKKYFDNTKYDNIFIGSSKKINTLKRIAFRYSQTSDPVLIFGETGTGKELIAKIIHSSSDRKDKVFHTINAGAILSELSVSEFFGATSGAYTGAVGHSGAFEFADKGTLFIDEIAELQSNIQAELLRVLQDGSVRRIGSNQIKHVNIRLISATNKNLINEIKNKKFRLDLFHRINTLEIYIPPLRERKEDIPDLLLHFCDELINEKPDEVFSLSNSFIDKLIEYDWPGNVRELRNVLRRAVFSSEEEILTADSVTFSGKEFYK